MALAATLHDPSGALTRLIERALPTLRALYGSVAVATSPPTAAHVNALLERAGVLVATPSQNHQGPLYRASLRGALASGLSTVHYLDLDRALHWAVTAPRELAAVIRLATRHPVLVLGRTPAAHRSHHVPLYATEVLANRLMGLRLAVSGRVDLLVPSFTLARAAAALLLARSRARDAAIYGEWASLVFGVGETFGGETAYLECRGLDWETPDRYRRAIGRLGLAAWRRRQETAAEWALRVDMAQTFVVGFERTLERWPVNGVRVRRLPPRGR